jgi:hypothetical protein
MKFTEILVFTTLIILTFFLVNHICKCKEGFDGICYAGTHNVYKNYWPAGCAPCPVGEVQPHGGRDQCYPCPPGYYQDETGEKKCKICPIGTYQDETGETNCNNCPSGHYTNTEGTTDDSECIPCPVGTYQIINDGGYPECSPCSGRTYQDEPGQTECKDCPPSGECDPKKGSKLGCSFGKYLNQDKSKCVNCPIGTYQDKIGQNIYECKICPSGKITTKEGTTAVSERIPCPAGTYQIINEEGNPECSPCSRGTYQDEEGQTRCKQCRIDYYQPKEGQTKCEFCPLGSSSNYPYTNCNSLNQLKYYDSCNTEDKYHVESNSCSDVSNLDKCDNYYYIQDSNKYSCRKSGDGQCINSNENCMLGVCPLNGGEVKDKQCENIPVGQCGDYYYTEGNGMKKLCKLSNDGKKCERSDFECKLVMIMIKGGLYIMKRDIKNM